VRALSKFAYYAAATAAHVQTVGHEYCEVTPIAAATGRPLRRTHRLGAALLYALVPYGAAKATAALAAAAQRSESAWLRELAEHIDALRIAVETLQLALFCLNLSPLRLVDRLLGLRIVRHGPHPARPNHFAPIGAVILIEMGVRTCDALLRRRAAAAERRRLHELRAYETAPPPAATRGEGGSAATPTPSVRLCSLCLAPRKKPAAGPCGHIFCWDCLHHWVAAKPECPLCRRPMAPQSVRHLVSYH
jgi:peroxin-10